MKRLILPAGLLAALVVGCVDAEPDRTNVVIERTAPPASTTVITDGNDSAPPADTNVDIDVNTSDETPDVVIE